MTVPPLRLVTYNVRSLRDDRRAVVAVLRACAPDVVCVQEAPRFAGRRLQAAWLARASGLRVVAAGRRAGGLLVLARPALEVVHRRALRLERAPRLHQRGLAVAALRTPVGPVTVASMHLDLHGGWRRRHVAEILAELGDGAPAVLAGDVNEEPSGPAWRQLAGVLQDAGAVAPVGAQRTFPASAPARRIDAVFADRRLRVLACGVPDLPAELLAAASDHLPLLALLAAPAEDASPGT